MHRHLALLLIVASLLTCYSVREAQAANPPMTTIRVKDMHCENCAAKIRRHLFTVAGVIKVQTDVKSHTAFVTPQVSHQPSPRAMWEAIEKAGFEVVQLAGPGGTFGEKPQY